MMVMCSGESQVKVKSRDVLSLILVGVKLVYLHKCCINRFFLFS